MDYHGTANDDIIDQKTLGIADGSNIYGGAGKDTITIGAANAIGEAGDDTIIGTSPYSGVAYWLSPAGVKVNFATGIVLDGYGGTDTLQNILTVQDSGYDDEFIGSSRSETFWLNAGNNTVVGGGGSDTVVFYNVKSTDVTISYNAAAGSFTVLRPAGGGNVGTNTLTGINTISFYGSESDNVNVTRDMFDTSSGFLRDRSYVAGVNMNRVQQLRVGDFNGDGKIDLLAVRINPIDIGITPEPLQVLVGDGAGHFTDQTAQLFAGGIPYVHYVPRIFTADFNNDGINDIFNPDFGVDAPPFPGGQNSLFLSNKSAGLIANATATLPQALRQNHGTSIGDVNKDGYLDILVNALNESTGHAQDLLINDGTGHFVSSPALLPASMTSATFNGGNTWSMLRDLNNDGYADMVLGTWDNNSHPSQVLLNNGHGSFASAVPIDLPRSGVAREVVIGIETIDLNGDALPDLVMSVTNGGANTDFYQVPYLQLLVNDGNGHFHDETQARLPQSTTKLPGATPHWYLSAMPADMNGDGYADIVVDDANSGPAKILYNDGHGNFKLGWEGAVGTHIVAVDVDGDGMRDLVESSNAGFSVLYNTMPRTVPDSHTYRATARGDTVNGTAAAETVYSGKGNDSIDGGAGLDRVVFSANKSAYTVLKTGAGFTVSGTDGSDTLTHVERLQFADSHVAIDIDGSGGQAYRLYQAAFNRSPDAGGLGFQMWAMDTVGFSLNQVAQGFIDSPEFSATYGKLNTTDFVKQLYANVLHRAPDDAGLKFHVDLLNAGTITRAQDLVGFSESPENQAALIGVIGNGFEYLPHV